MAFKSTESIDTNIILRLILKDNDILYERALELMERPDITYYISDFALLETVFVLTKIEGFDRETIVAALMKIMTRPNVKTSRQHFIDIFYMYIEHPKLSFADCYLAIEAGLKGYEPLWTFDQDLAKQSPTAKLLQ